MVENGPLQFFALWLCKLYAKYMKDGYSICYLRTFRPQLKLDKKFFWRVTKSKNLINWSVRHFPTVIYQMQQKEQTKYFKIFRCKEY